MHQQQRTMELPGRPNSSSRSVQVAGVNARAWNGPSARRPTECGMALVNHQGLDPGGQLPPGEALQTDAFMPRSTHIIAAEALAGVHAQCWRCINIRPGRLPARPWSGLPTVRRALNNRAPSRRYGRARPLDGGYKICFITGDLCRREAHEPAPLRGPRSLFPARGVGFLACGPLTAW